MNQSHESHAVPPTRSQSRPTPTSLEVGRGTGLAIWESYQQTGALQVECENCGAPVGTWCTADDGRRVRRVPCVARCKADDTGWTAATTSAVVHGGRDFSEPLHAGEERS